MRDPLLDGGNAYLVAYREAGEAGRGEAGRLAEADQIVSGLTGWCRLLLYDTDVINDWEEGQNLSDLLVLPSAQSPLLVFEAIADVHRRDSLRRAFAGLLENGERSDAKVMAWLLGKALAKGLVECLEPPNEILVHPISGFWNLASSHDVSHFSFEETLQSLLCNSPSAFAMVLSELEAEFEIIMRDPGIGTYTRERLSTRQ